MTADSQELELARRQLRAQRRELRDLTARVVELEQALKDERERSEAAIAAEQRRADRYIDQLRALRSSTSWRITRPLRTRAARTPTTGTDA